MIECWRSGLVFLVSAVLGVLWEGDQRAADRLRRSEPNPDPGAELCSSHPTQNTEGLSGRTLPLLESQSVESGMWHHFLESAFASSLLLLLLINEHTVLLHKVLLYKKKKKSFFFLCQYFFYVNNHLFFLFNYISKLTNSTPTLDTFIQDMPINNSLL